MSETSNDIEDTSTSASFPHRKIRIRYWEGMPKTFKYHYNCIEEKEREEIAKLNERFRRLYW